MQPKAEPPYNPEFVSVANSNVRTRFMINHGLRSVDIISEKMSMWMGKTILNPGIRFLPLK